MQTWTKQESERKLVLQTVVDKMSTGLLSCKVCFRFWVKVTWIYYKPEATVRSQAFLPQVLKGGSLRRVVPDHI